ncbi:MAG: hypothetical protein Q4C26_05480 [Bacteroidales bacterium]|nr:hypothetical protein [Bacteroidales bacterium]
MRLSIFNKSLFIALFILICFPTINPLNAAGITKSERVNLSDSLSDSLSRAKREARRTRYGDHRTYRGYEGWKKVVPTHVKLQYAGDMGVFAAGCGWDYGRKEQWETDFMIGFLPKKYADKAHLTCTLKQNYSPFSLQINKNLSFEPIVCGLYMTMIYGEKYWVREPSRYPMKHYYGFTTRIRFNIFIGESLTWSISKEKRIRDLSLYYELSANDLNIVSKCTNSYLKLKDIVFFSAGIKLHIIGTE